MNLLDPRAPFQRLIREIMVTHDDTLRIKKDALEALQEASEAFICSIMESKFPLSIMIIIINCNSDELVLYSRRANSYPTKRYAASFISNENDYWQALDFESSRVLSKLIEFKYQRVNILIVR